MSSIRSGFNDYGNDYGLKQCRQPTNNKNMGMAFMRIWFPVIDVTRFTLGHLGDHMLAISGHGQ